MEPDDELTHDAPLVPHLGNAPDRTDPNRIDDSRTDPATIDALRREIRTLRTRLDRIDAEIADRTTDDPAQ